MLFAFVSFHFYTKPQYFKSFCFYSITCIWSCLDIILKIWSLNHKEQHRQTCSDTESVTSTLNVFPGLLSQLSSCLQPPFFGNKTLPNSSWHIWMPLDSWTHVSLAFHPGYSTDCAHGLHQWCLPEDRQEKLCSTDLSRSFSSLWYIWLWGAYKAYMWPDVHLWVCSKLVPLFPLREVPGMVMDECSSSSWDLCCGIPQVSIFALLPFNMYLRPMGEILWRFGVTCYWDADDTQLYLFLISPRPWSFSSFPMPRCRC